MFRCSSHRSMPKRKRRSGFSIRGLLIGLGSLAAVGGVVWYTFPSLSFSSQDTGPMLHTVALGDFAHDITERGNVESASNVDIRCEVETRGSQGTMILELIDEGTYVKPGDILCKLDSSSLEQDLVQQQIVCNTSEAAVIQARNNYETALIAKEEYLNGTYAEEKLGIEGEIFVAEEELRQAQQKLDYTNKLYARGYVTELAVEADTFSVEDAKKKLEQGKTKLEVLEKYKKAKMIKQLDADIKTSEAKLKSEEHSHGLDKEKLADITAQVEKCTIFAPEHGQVVYANVTDRRGGSEIIIEEGGSVRERQVIFRLPDPNRMQVKAKINEASVSMVEEGMRAGIRLDAFPDVELKGEVEKVNEYPEPTSFFSGTVKEYETTIRIDLPGGEVDPAAEETANPGDASKTGADTKEKDTEADEPPAPDGDSETEPSSTEKPEAESNAPVEQSAPSAEASPETDATDTPASSSDQVAKRKSPRMGPKISKSDDSGDSIQLRPGMTAEVKIRVQTIPNVLQVPVQAVVEHGGKNYCLTYDKASGWAKREIKIGATNDKTVVIREGLEEGDKVVMGAAKHRDKVTWPKIEDVPPPTATDEFGEDGARPGPSGERSGGPGGREGGGAGGGDGGREGGGGTGDRSGGPPNPAEAFKRLDANSDGKLTEDEAPGPMKAMFSTADKNGDGGVDVGEFSAAMSAAMGGGRGRGQGGPGMGGSERGGGGGLGGRRDGAGGPGGGGRPGGGSPRPGGSQ